MPDVIEDRIKRWKEKLIDLSKRNRLLNFRSTKVTTIKIVDELPSEILNLLALENEGMEFVPVETEGEDLFSAQSSSQPKEDGEPAEEFKKYKKEELEERHKDNYLQTNLTKEHLAKNLFRISSKANSVMEEQGYNVLFLALGCLEWYESDESDVKMQAPIILVPVELTRTSVRGKFKLKYQEEEQLILNPALIVKLQNDFNVSLEPIDDEVENINPRKIFTDLQESIKHLKRWRVTNDIYLSLFSFVKFIMYKDIGKYWSFLLNNSIIRLICGQSPGEKTLLGLSLEENDLDKTLSPSKVYQILDADSSQQQAILAVKEGKNLVIEGPPGTGKSQTIANITAEFLAEGKKVLFVSQKMAALEVVKKRLDNNKLGDFCLEMHSRKTNKNEVIKELVRVLQMQKKQDHSHDQEMAKLDTIKSELNEYVKAIHMPFGNLEMTPFQAFGIISKNSETRDIGFVFKDSKTWNRKKYNTCCDLLDSLSYNLKKIQDPQTHPWKASKLSELHYEDRIKLIELIDSLIENHINIKSLADRLAANTFFKNPSSISEVEILLNTNKFLQGTPNVTKDILVSKRWNSLSTDIDSIIRDIKLFGELRKELENKYKFNSFIQADLDFNSIIARYERYSKNILLYLTPEFWKDRATIKRYIVDNTYKPNIKTLLGNIEKIRLGKLTAQKIKQNDSFGIELFGELWKSTETDWQLIDGFAKWMVQFRQYVMKKYFIDSIFEGLQNNKIDKTISDSFSKNLIVALDKFKQEMQQFLEIAKIDELKFLGAVINDAPLGDVIEYISSLKINVDTLEDWARYQDSLKDCELAGLDDFISKVLFLKVSYDNIASTFKCQFLRSWLDAAFSERMSLKRFRGEDHEKLIQKFCELDRKQIELAKIRIQHILSGKLDATYSPSKGSELDTLLRESRKMRAHMSIRKLFKRAPNVVSSLKPCLMMSPLTVAQFLSPELIKFDLVIFDEASQIPPEDAIGAIIRGAQVVIAGDSKQLPPTSFFQSEVITSEDEDETDDALPEDLDSILDECAVSRIPKTMLRWHYRSKHESLIAFSNKHFYDNHLFTFPCANEECADLGTKFNYLPGASYDRGGTGTNIEEARDLARAIFKHFKENPALSLGVGTFSIRQKYAIEDVLEEMLREDNSLEAFFSKDKPEHFFVKNLESIQGDERDVIFISVGYGKNANGRLPMNFGPINQNGGARRLNVLITRARKRLEIFSSIKGDDFDLSKTDSDGVHLLKNYLDFAEKGKRALLQETDVGGILESPFEESVCELLTNKGYKVKKQVGCSGYRIDLAIADDANPGKYIIGIECDGAYYHHSATARDRDRLRQQVLEDLSWNIYRIWSTDWFKNQRREFEKLVDAIEKAKRGELLKKKPTIDDPPEFKYKNISSRQNKTEIVPYSTTPIRKKSYPDNFYNGDISKICSILKEVVDHESPIHKDEAERRAVQYWGIGAVGSRVRSILEEAALIGVEEKMIKKKGNFYWSINMDTPIIRNREAIDVSKKIEYIAPEEIREAAVFILKKEYGVPKDGLIEQVASLLGIQRVTEDIGDYIWNAIKKYKKEHKIDEVNDKLVLVKEKISDCPKCGQKLRCPDKNIVLICPKCKTNFKNS
jgi:very-short-patch-repair endonuclease/predicted nucleic-acid-binding protein